MHYKICWDFFCFVDKQDTTLTFIRLISHISAILVCRKFRGFCQENKHSLNLAILPPPEQRKLFLTAGDRETSSKLATPSFCHRNQSASPQEIWLNLVMPDYMREIRPKVVTWTGQKRDIWRHLETLEKEGRLWKQTKLFESRKREKSPLTNKNAVNVTQMFS